MSNIFVILPDNLFADYKSVEFLSTCDEIYILEDPVFFESNSKTKLLYMRSAMKYYADWLGIAFSFVEKQKSLLNDLKSSNDKIRTPKIKYISYLKIINCKQGTVEKKIDEKNNIFDFLDSLGLKSPVNMFRLSNAFSYKNDPWEKRYHGIGVIFIESPSFILPYRFLRDTSYIKNNKFEPISQHLGENGMYKDLLEKLIDFIFITDEETQLRNPVNIDREKSESNKKLIKEIIKKAKYPEMSKEFSITVEENYTDRNIKYIKDNFCSKTIGVIRKYPFKHNLVEEKIDLMFETISTERYQINEILLFLNYGLVSPAYLIEQAIEYYKEGILEKCCLKFIILFIFDREIKRINYFHYRGCREKNKNLQVEEKVYSTDWFNF